MKYINKKDILEIGINWENVVDVIYATTALLDKREVVQPIKPYLRYKDLTNRIIAMPAYVGGDIGIAGIKWIASFPKNLEKNLARAHSVIILNDENTGIPLATINTPLISGIRTAGVTGAVIKRYIANLSSNEEKINYGIIGFGPIGRLHLEMICELFGNTVDKIFIYDLRDIDYDDISEKYKDKVVIAKNWQEVYSNSKIFITCTVSSAPYIDLPPQKGTLQLNISLRDFNADLVKYMDLMIVDDWDEICRENTDIEQMHLKHNLNKSDVIEIHEALHGAIWNDLSEKVVMFNPMGMAMYDIAIGKYYYDKSVELEVGLVLSE